MVYAIAAPIQPHGHEPAAALALVMTKERFVLFNETALVSLVLDATRQIGAAAAPGA
jgi:DNA-binding IclR family transcriptional regulator